MLRIANSVLLGLLAALASAAVGRPGFAWVRSQGWSGPARCAPDPDGALAFVLALLLAVTALGVAALRAGGSPFLRKCFERTLLGLAAAAVLLRPGVGQSAGVEPSVAIGAALDAAVRGDGWASPVGLCLRGRPLRAHLRTLPPSDGPLLSPLAGDLPGTLYRVLSRDGTSAFFTAVGPRGILRDATGAPRVRLEGSPQRAGLATPYPFARVVP